MCDEHRFQNNWGSSTKEKHLLLRDTTTEIHATVNSLLILCSILHQSFDKLVSMQSVYNTMHISSRIKQYIKHNEGVI